MTLYGQFCPVAKASEIIGEKWTMLILRELLLGTSRFSDFQRAISRMSPTILSRRLKQLEQVPTKGLLHHSDVCAFSIILGDDIAPFPKIIQVLPLGPKDCLKA